jgi:hypothetical protein
MTIHVQDAIWLHGLALTNGYRDPKPLAGRRYACIVPFMFTHAIIVGKMGDECGYEDRWCYHSYPAAKAALDEWDGTGEPNGWHRHPDSGRRRDLERNEEWINP